MTDRKKFPVALSVTERADLQALADNGRCLAGQWIRARILNAHRHGKAVSSSTRRRQNDELPPSRRTFQVQLSAEEYGWLTDVYKRDGVRSRAEWVRVAIRNGAKKLHKQKRAH